VSADAALLRDTARSLFSAQKKLAGEGSPGGAGATWDELESLGMTGAGVSEGLGGSGGTLSDAATLVFEAARHAAAVPLAETTMIAGWLDELASWSWTGGPETVALLDPVPARCSLDADAMVLDGELLAVPWGRVARRVIAFAECDGKPVQAAIDTSRVIVVEVDNIAGEPRDTIRLDGLRLAPTEWAFSAVDRQAVRRRGALARSVAMAGVMTAVFELTVGYAQDRVQFGRPISRFQAVQQLLAQLAGEVAIAVTAARAAVDHAESGDGALAAVAAKIRVSRSATNVARLAHQIFGAIGVTEECELQALTNRLWCWRDEFGTEAEWGAVLTTSMLGDASRLWETITAWAIEGEKS
jgi:acyl-CoA dehydrogenase